jgi:hypothetical protein
MDRYEATPKIGAFAVHVEANDFLALVRDESVLAEMQAPLDEYMVPPCLASTRNGSRDGEAPRRLSRHASAWLFIRGSPCSARHRRYRRASAHQHLSLR